MIVWIRPTSEAEYFAFHRKYVLNPRSYITSGFSAIRIIDNLFIWDFYKSICIWHAIFPMVWYGEEPLFLKKMHQCSCKVNKGIFLVYSLFNTEESSDWGESGFVL